MLFVLEMTELSKSARGREATAEDKMAANYADMQTHEWFTGGGWITDFDLAKEQSKKTGKPIFAYFTRTYAP